MLKPRFIFATSVEMFCLDNFIPFTFIENMTFSHLYFNPLTVIDEYNRFGNLNFLWSWNPIWIEKVDTRMSLFFGLF